MVKVTAHQVHDVIKSITVNGHALFADHGSDIVCAGISSVVIGGGNAIDMAGGFADMNEKTQTITLKSTSTKTDIILFTIWTQLETIALQYPQNIQLTKG